VRRNFKPVVVLLPLLVVYRSVSETLAFRTGLCRSDYAGFTIGRYHNLPRDSNLSIFLDLHFQYAVTNFLIRPHVRTRVAGDGIILTGSDVKETLLQRP